MSVIKELIELSQYTAQHPRLTQGGGSNCSVKARSTMVIKASGYFPEDVTQDEGYVFVNKNSGKAVPNSPHKPSLETSLHLLLNDYTIHTHAIAAMALLCSEEGPSIISKLFLSHNYQLIDFAIPGMPLSNQVIETVGKEWLNTTEEQILFLKNHGLFVSSPSKERAMALHESVVETCENYFPKHGIRSNQVLADNQFLTPDHVVYASLNRENASKKKQYAINETIEAMQCTLVLMQSKQLNPVYLNNEVIQELQSMKSEKHRQEVLEDWK